MARFVLEIGFEELPSRFLPVLESELDKRMSDALVARQLNFAILAVAVTPRRAAIMIKDLDAVQPVIAEEIVGPPVGIAYDAKGELTRAALGFAAGKGVPVEFLYQISTEKGEYLACRVQSGGQTAAGVLAEICPPLILGLPFTKRMRWGNGDILFARPLRWIMALLDAEVVPFSLGDLHSDRLVYGHRVHDPGPFALRHASDYPECFAERGSIALESSHRRAVIVSRGDTLAAGIGGAILWNDELLEEVQSLTEHPVPLIGNIDPTYLELPREVLLTSMEKHQKCFGVQRPDGELLPHFLTVLNLDPPDLDMIRRGWERVLRARLEDARFFWRADLAVDLADWQAKLDNVTFLAGLGSMGDKTRRLAKLCGWLFDAVGTGGPEEGKNLDAALAARAGLLSKIDRVSGMVGDFDSLQGVMGGIYASIKGENPAVAAAVAQQYLPAGPDSPLPATLLGAILSIADKADTLAGCFGLGMAPTGTADPYALRRAALGIARILLERGLRFPVRDLFARALSLYGEAAWKYPAAETLERLCEFFTGRVRNMLPGDTLLVEAVVAADALDVWGAAKRLEALSAMSRRPDFDQAAQTFKRVANIIRRQTEPLQGLWREELLVAEADRRLARAVGHFVSRFDALRRADDYPALFGLLAGLSPEVDAFFADVMVMCVDRELRRNRLNLLQALLDRLSALADFTVLQH
jgi:glycyl-tRNA synthetase beta chain